MSNSLLESIQDRLKAALDAEDYFKTLPAIPIYTERLKSLETEVQSNILSGLGLAVMIVTVQARNAQPQQIGQWFDIVIVGRVMENPVLNTKLPSASAVACAVSYFGKRTHFSINNRNFPYIPQEVVLAAPPRGLENLRVYDAIFSMASAGTNDAPTR